MLDIGADYMEKLTVYNDPDYGWSVQESSGYIHSCQNLDDVIATIKMIDSRYQPSNNVVEDGQAKECKDFSWCRWYGTEGCNKDCFVYPPPAT